MTPFAEINHEMKSYRCWPVVCCGAQGSGPMYKISEDPLEDPENTVSDHFDVHLCGCVQKTSNNKKRYISTADKFWPRYSQNCRNGKFTLSIFFSSASMRFFAHSFLP